MDLRELSLLRLQKQSYDVFHTLKVILDKDILLDKTLYFTSLLLQFLVGSFKVDAVYSEMLIEYIVHFKRGHFFLLLIIL